MIRPLKSLVCFLHGVQRLLTAELAAQMSNPFKELSILDRLTTPLVFIAMVVGVIIGEFAPGIRSALDIAKFNGVSIRAWLPPSTNDDLY